MGNKKAPLRATKPQQGDTMSIAEKQCSIKNCTRPFKVNNMCSYHQGIRWRLDHPLYSVWASMKARCYNPNNRRYADWGERGITVCDRWRNSYESFVQDMGARPTPKHSLDRIDNNKPYSPDNCKWSTASEQSLNKRVYKTNTSGHIRIYHYPNDNRWVSTYIKNNKTLTIGSFKTLDEAIDAYHKEVGVCRQCNQ